MQLAQSVSKPPPVYVVSMEDCVFLAECDLKQTKDMALKNILSEEAKRMVAIRQTIYSHLKVIAQNKPRQMEEMAKR